MRHILLIEDSPEYQLLVRVALGDRYNVVCVNNAEDAWTELAKEKFDIILLDVGLPGKDGLALCQELRQNATYSTTPILFVTGRNETHDLVQGFEFGGDDYITKPFHPDELRARVEARFKRVVSSLGASADHFWKADLRFAIGKQKVMQTSADRERDLDLTPNEYKILYLLAKNEGRVLSRADILKEVWGENLHVVERTVDKHICSLRRKLGTAASYVASVPGKGYQFRVQEADRLASAN